MADRININELGNAIAGELTTYSKQVTEALDDAAHAAIKDLTNTTRKTAPKRTGNFRRHISWQREKTNVSGVSYVWYVRAPHYRLTHLLVKGHLKKNGERTKADPFLQNALAQVLPEYEKAVEEAIKNGK